MTTRTFADIVSEGMLKAGRDDLSARMNGYFNDWLARQAKSWPWPALTVIRQMTVPAGSSLFTIVADGATTEKWSRILDNCWLYRTDRSARQRLRIRQVTGTPSGILDDATGLPTSLQVFKKTDFTFQGLFDVISDREYMLFMEVVNIPARIVVTSDIPWYPEDDTCIQAVMAETLKYANGVDDSSYQAAMQELGEMVSKDRMRHGIDMSVNSQLQLDGGVFR